MENKISTKDIQKYVDFGNAHLKRQDKILTLLQKNIGNAVSTRYITDKLKLQNTDYALYPCQLLERKKKVKSVKIGNMFYWYIPD